MARHYGGGQDRNRYSGQRVRQGEIVLKQRWQRIVFVAGFAGLALVLLLAGSLR